MCKDFAVRGVTYGIKGARSQETLPKKGFADWTTTALGRAAQCSVSHTFYEEVYFTIQKNVNTKKTYIKQRNIRTPESRILHFKT